MIVLAREPHGVRMVVEGLTGRFHQVGRVDDPRVREWWDLTFVYGRKKKIGLNGLHVRNVLYGVNKKQIENQEWIIPQGPKWKKKGQD